mgnify:CR=1 FL=1
MDKKILMESLNKIANILDNSGLHKESTTLTNVMKRLAEKLIAEFIALHPTAKHVV